MKFFSSSQLLLMALTILAFLFSCKSRSTAIVDPPVPTQETALPHATNAKTDSLQNFAWESSYCEHQGKYNSKLYSAKQLKDTHYLWHKFESLNELEDVTFMSLQELTADTIKRKSIKLDADYRSATDRLKNLKLIPSKFWATVKDLKLKELEELYALRKLTIEAYRTPVILLNNSYSKKCEVYVNALASEDSVLLFKAWENLIEEKKKNNGAPEKLAAKFKEQRQSPERLQYAKIELMTFGWWNCANHQRKYNSLYREMPMEEEFNKLFVKMDSDCDDVD
ncbi:hypothetical protein [Rufibacter sp. LB8]|nr:hypothetical protein [Rufibacter sp. LB8]